MMGKWEGRWENHLHENWDLSESTFYVLSTCQSKWLWILHSLVFPLPTENENSSQPCQAHLKLLCPFQEMVMVFFSQCIHKIFPCDRDYESPFRYQIKLGLAGGKHSIRNPFTGLRWLPWPSSLFVTLPSLVLFFLLSSWSCTNFQAYNWSVSLFSWLSALLLLTCPTNNSP